MKPHIHKEAIVHFANGAEIETLKITTGRWELIPNPRFSDDCNYRVSPECDYAFNYIEHNYGNKYLSYYKLALEGALVTYITNSHSMRSQYTTKIRLSTVNTFEHFLSLVSSGVDICVVKPNLVLWICDHLVGSPSGSYRPELYLPEYQSKVTNEDIYEAGYKNTSLCPQNFVRVPEITKD